MGRLALKQGLVFNQSGMGVRDYRDIFNKVFLALAVSAGTTLLLGVIMFGLRGLSLSKPKINPTSVVPVMAESSSSTVPIVLKVNIANNGLVFVSGSRVTAISGDTITTSMFWGSTNFTWTIKTSGVTKFVNHLGQKQTILDIKVGDIVNVTGKLIGDSDQLTVNAEFVRKQ